MIHTIRLGLTLLPPPQLLRATNKYKHAQAKVMHQLMHNKLLWEPCFKNLISIASDDHLYHWQVRTPWSALTGGPPPAPPAARFNDVRHILR